MPQRNRGQIRLLQLGSVVIRGNNPLSGVHDFAFDDAWLALSVWLSGALTLHRQ